MFHFLVAMSQLSQFKKIELLASMLRSNDQAHRHRPGRALDISTKQWKCVLYLPKELLCVCHNLISHWEAFRHLYLCLVFNNFQYFQYFFSKLISGVYELYRRVRKLKTWRQVEIFQYTPFAAPPNRAAPTFPPFAAPPDPFTGCRLLGCRPKLDI